MDENLAAVSRFVRSMVECGSSHGMTCNQFIGNKGLLNF